MEASKKWQCEELRKKVYEDDRQLNEFVGFSKVATAQRPVATFSAHLLAHLHGNLCAVLPKFQLKKENGGLANIYGFTMLHPQYVFAAVGGGNMHSFTLPLKSYQGETLIWPNGMGNTDAYCSFDYDCYKAVKQLFYMGDMDFNDAVPYNDSYTEEERQQVYRLFGKVGMPDRWKKYQELVKTIGPDNIECKTNPGLDHRPGDEIRDYITVFLRDIVAGTSNYSHV